jgi:hypothetical protein
MQAYNFGSNKVYHEEGGNIFLRNAGKLSDFYATSKLLPRHLINVYSALVYEYFLYMTNLVIRLYILTTQYKQGEEGLTALKTLYYVCNKKSVEQMVVCSLAICSSPKNIIRARKLGFFFCNPILFANLY